MWQRSGGCIETCRGSNVTVDSQIQLTLDLLVLGSNSGLHDMNAPNKVESWRNLLTLGNMVVQLLI